MEFIVPAITFTLGSIIILIVFLRIPKRETCYLSWVGNYQCIGGTHQPCLYIPAKLATCPVPITQNLIATSLSGLAFISFGYLIFSYLRFHPRKSQLQTIWLVSIVIWLVAYIMSAFVVSNMTTPAEIQAIPNIIGLAGTGLLGASLVGILIWNYYHVTLPELANRSAYWIFLTLFMSAGIAFISSGLISLVIPALTLMFLALVGLAIWLCVHQYFRCAL